MHSSFYVSSTISETLDIVERGLRRLGVTGEMAGHSGYDRAENKPYHQITAADVQLMRDLTAQGLRQAEIAQRIGCSQAAVCKYLRRHGIHQRPGRKVRA